MTLEKLALNASTIFRLPSALEKMNARTRCPMRAKKAMPMATARLARLLTRNRQSYPNSLRKLR